MRWAAAIPLPAPGGDDLLPGRHPLSSQGLHLCLAGSAGMCQQQGHLHQLEAAGREQGGQRDIQALSQPCCLFSCSGDAEYLH